MVGSDQNATSSLDDQEIKISHDKAEVVEEATQVVNSKAANEVKEAKDDEINDKTIMINGSGDNRTRMTIRRDDLRDQ